MEYLAGEYCHAFISPRNYICSLGKIKIFHHTILYPMSCAKYKGMRRVSSKKRGGGCKGMATVIISQSQIAMDINPTSLHVYDALLDDVSIVGDAPIYGQRDIPKMCCV
jgi:hypothetical protein